MRIIILSFAVIVLSFIKVNVQWYSQFEDSALYFLGVSFTNYNNGIVEETSYDSPSTIRHHKIIFKTSNLGKNWQLDNFSTAAQVYNISFYDEQNFLAVVDYNTIARTTNDDSADNQIFFSEDSLYSEFIGDTINCFIINKSDLDVVIDSIYTSTSDISGYFSYGYLMYLIRDNHYFFINLFDHYPNHPTDTLNYMIPAHDSIQLQIYDIDLCPICKKQPKEYFEDTLKFVFTFIGENVYSFSKSIPISGEGHPSDVKDQEILLSEFSLEQNYPNPFNSSTSIQYVINNREFVTLKVYDLLGNEVSTLINKYQDEGRHQVEFDATKFSSGVYFYLLKAGSFVETKKMIYLK